MFLSFFYTAAENPVYQIFYQPGLSKVTGHWPQAWKPDFKKGHCCVTGENNHQEISLHHHLAMQPCQLFQYPYISCVIHLCFWLMQVLHSCAYILRKTYIQTQLKIGKNKNVYSVLPDVLCNLLYIKHTEYLFCILGDLEWFRILGYCPPNICFV